MLKFLIFIIATLSCTDIWSQRKQDSFMVRSLPNFQAYNFPEPTKICLPPKYVVNRLDLGKGYLHFIDTSLVKVLFKSTKQKGKRAKTLR